MIDLETSILDGIRERAEKQRKFWIAGVPTPEEADAIFTQVARALLIEVDQVKAIAKKNEMEIVG